jgi:hypothetical protein
MQGDSGRNVITLGGGCIDDCDNEVRLSMCLTPND